MRHQELAVLPAFFRVVVADQLVFIGSVSISHITASRLIEHLPVSVNFACLGTCIIWYLAKIGALPIFETIKKSTSCTQFKR